MSRPAISCSCKYTARASTYCSRNWLFTIASRKLRMPRFSLYQLGRGSDPVIVVGSMMSLVARYIVDTPPKSPQGGVGGSSPVTHIRTAAVQMETPTRVALARNAAAERCEHGGNLL